MLSSFFIIGFFYLNSESNGVIGEGETPDMPPNPVFYYYTVSCCSVRVGEDVKDLAIFYFKVSKGFWLLTSVLLASFM